MNEPLITAINQAVAKKEQTVNISSGRYIV